MKSTDKTSASGQYQTKPPGYHYARHRSATLTVASQTFVARCPSGIVPGRVPRTSQKQHLDLVREGSFPIIAYIPHLFTLLVPLLTRWQYRIPSLSTVTALNTVHCMWYIHIDLDRYPDHLIMMMMMMMSKPSPNATKSKNVQMYFLVAATVSKLLYISYKWDDEMTQCVYCSVRMILSIHTFMILYL